MHSAGMDVGHGTTARSDVGNGLRLMFYTSIGLTPDTMVAVLRVSPNDMLWLTPESASLIGIRYTRII